VEVERIVCMQCGRTIRDFKVANGLVSHGLCVDCGAEFAREIEALEPVQASSFELPPLALAAAR
jgi:DNA-directed RNA polymerase subunit RPC12/RpoP